ncbi:MAG: hypothetical protein QNJ36_21665 [Calothrix sp. MO_167.B42]|nr:hypothetical protein [Calothrix sp. MO_167.B42]
MKEVLELIEQRKQEFAKLKFFEFLQDQSIDHKQRLNWIPCFAHIAMGFDDLLKYHFRQEPAENKIQELINKHTFEEESHYLWFLKDIETLELNYSMKFNDYLKFMWHKDLSKIRLTCSKIMLQTSPITPLNALVSIVTIEATGDILFTHTTKLTKELQEITGQTYYFFGDQHLNAEKNHAIYTDSIEYLMETIQLTEEEKIKAFEIVDQIFEIVTDFFHELMAYVENNHINKKLMIA